jgi:hypothetical protein
MKKEFIFEREVSAEKTPKILVVYIYMYNFYRDNSVIETVSKRVLFCFVFSSGSTRLNSGPQIC